MKILVTGGVRSGKSRHAEQLLADRADVTYLATGPTEADDPDPDWAARLAAHRARRPDDWATLETRDVAAVLDAATGPVLVDCLGTWLAGVLDDEGLWDAPLAAVTAFVDGWIDRIVAALPADVVLVTNEVGLGVVPEHRSGRLFRDLLGTINIRLGAACDEVHLVVAGRVLVLGQS